jgi:MFS transporter, DHA3 family, macrolide efflux protein
VLQQTEKNSSLRNFFIIAIGQLISLLGSGLTNFAIALWVLLHTGSVTRFGLLLLIVTVPAFIVMPLAGASADRWNRRLIMILSDTGAAVSTLAIAVMFIIGDPSIWVIAGILGVSSICGAFRFPAYLASVPLLVPKTQLGRANGVIQLGQGLGKILAPMLAGVLLVSIGIQGILFIDFATFVIAVVMLLFVRIPTQRAITEVNSKPKKASLLKEALMGWTYIRARSGLLALLLFFTLTSFLMSMAEVLVPPMLLASASPAIVGTVVSIFGCGLLAGSILMSAWAGPKRRIYGVYIFAIVHALALMIAGARPSVFIMAAGLFLWTFSMPLLNGYMRVIYQTKTPSDMQGRVFATASMFAQAMAPIALVMSGPLADRVFIPMLSEGGMLAASVGRVIGVGKGRGIGLMLILMGLSVAIGTLIGYLYPRLRKVEFELPDAIADHNEAVVDLTPSLATVEGATPQKPTAKVALPVYSTPATDTKIA